MPGKLQLAAAARQVDRSIPRRHLTGFPILLYDTMESCAPVNDFFRSYLLRGEINSDDSWLAAGQALYDFFSFLQAHDLDWRDIDRGESKTLLSAYRDYCFAEHGHRRNTVRHRLFYIIRFYNFSHKKKVITELPFEIEERITARRWGLLKHIDASGNLIKSNDAMPRKYKTLPKYLSMDSAKALITATENIHHRMIIKFALQTGLRREELASIPVYYIKQALRTPGNTKNVRLQLDPSDEHGMQTKGNKARDVYVSRKFLTNVNAYITRHRGERANRSTSDNGRLFVNRDGEQYANGGKALDKIIRDIGEKIGLDVSPHMLRHTYATHTLVYLRRSDTDIDPVVFLSRQLGHSSIATTEIYTHLANEYVDNAVLQYDDELNDIGLPDG